MNPTDYFLQLMRDGDAVGTLVTAQRGRNSLLAMEGGERTSNPEVDSDGGERVPAVSEANGGQTVQKSATLDTRALAALSKGTAAPWWYQVWVLARRNGRSYMRNPVMFVSEFAQYFGMGLFVGRSGPIA
jgi:hypothetical protein